MVFVVAVLQRTRLVKDGKYDMQVQTVERDMKENSLKPKANASAVQLHDWQSGCQMTILLGLSTVL